MTATRPTTRRDHRTTTHTLRAGDGHPLTLLNVHGRAAPTKGPVLLVHGAGVRAELFRPPLPVTLVDALIDDGWDVWLLNWRASIDLPSVSWTLDDAAAYDHPPAVRAVLDTTGAASAKAIIHCQGSTSFAMSAVAGLLPGVDTIIANAVSLHPVVPHWSRIKISRLAPLLRALTPVVSPAWGNQAHGLLPRAIVAMVRAGHHECDNTVCKLVSFTYGSGRPALWSHRQLDEATHDWIRGEFGAVPLSFFAQMNQCVRAGALVPVSERPGLPASYTGQAPRTDARFVLLAGQDNRCFLPESQERTAAFLQAHRPGRDRLHRLRGYGHLDVFLGRRSAADIHPLILKELAG